jgi:hypothetical protein
VFESIHVDFFSARIDLFTVFNDALKQFLQNKRKFQQFKNINISPQFFRSSIKSYSKTGAARLCLISFFFDYFGNTFLLILGGGLFCVLLLVL